MSEAATQVSTGERALSETDIRNFMMGKRLAGCAVCSHYNWSVRDATSLPCGCASDKSATADVGIVMLVCQNCGVLEFHDRGVIARWLDCQRRQS